MLHPLRWIRRIVAAVVLAAGAYYAVSAVQVLTASRAPGAVAAAPHEPAVIVVGAGAEVPHGLGPALLARLAHARQLWVLRRAPRIVVCGRTAAEVEADKAWLVRRGVAAADVGLATGAALPGQLRLAAAQLQPERRALVVADAWQTLWMVHVAAAVGIQATPSPVMPQASAGARAWEVLVQAAAVSWGRIAGFAQTGFIAG